MADEKTPEKPAAKKQADVPQTPSGLALAEVGPDGDGEAYQAAKKKHRWG
jgi:hypothetical protein